MKKYLLVIVGIIISLFLGNIARSVLENNQITGIRLGFGWANDYHTAHFWGFPFASMQSPPAGCFCNIDRNPVAVFLNTIIFAIIIFVVATFIIKQVKKLNQKQ